MRVTSALAVPGLGYAEVHRDMWIVRCPRDWCDNALAVERWQQRFECFGPDSCAWTSPIVWPADPEGIEALLAMRPARKNRNWLPGETLQELLAENAAHDVLPPDWLTGPGHRVLLDTVDDRVTGGQLAAALPDYRRREIGA
jgi:hypothetical protein